MTSGSASGSDPARRQDLDAIEDERDEFARTVLDLAEVRELVARLRPMAPPEEAENPDGRHSKVRQAVSRFLVSLVAFNLCDEWLVARVTAGLTAHLPWEDRASKRYPWVDVYEARDRDLVREILPFTFKAAEWNPHREQYQDFKARALDEASRAIEAYADQVCERFDSEYLPVPPARRFGAASHRRLAERLVRGTPWPDLTASGEPSISRKPCTELAQFIGLNLPKGKAGRPPKLDKKRRRLIVR